MIRKAFFEVHKWLGLFSGVVVLIVSLSGCVYVFTDELKDIFHRGRLYVRVPENQHRKSFSLLLTNARRALGSDYEITRSEILPGMDRSWIFRASKTNSEAIGHWNYYSYYFRVYVNPYTGEIIHIEDSKNDFFQLVLSTHMNLLLGPHIGKPLVGYSTLIFFVLLVSGLVLWWPKKWKRRTIKKGLTFKKKAKVKRFNYDLHNVLGFYSLLPALLITITGLVYSFDWVDNSIQYIADGGKKVSKQIIPDSSPAEAYNARIMDNIIERLLSDHKDADQFSLRFRNDKLAPLDVQIRFKESRTHLFAWYYFDRNSGDLLLKYGHNELNGGAKLRSMNYDLHVGSIGGMSTKILAFMASLICASLPVTGFLIWFYKRRKIRTS